MTETAATESPADATPRRRLRTLRVRGRSVPVVLPSARDPRLHLASVIITVHVVGIAALGFQVTVPQILSAIVTCAAIEVAITLRRTGALVWPASAMLTGSGVALIFRVLETERGAIWGWEGWWLFAAVAGLSLLTKYVIRWRGSHVFNPSNVGLVVAFLVLGSDRVAPLDFWWAPFGLWMAVAYAVILGGGVAITARLGLLAMAATFWATLAGGLAAVAAPGHCITAAWSLQPVCDSHFWWVVVSSPEVLIFLFFMITDPKTIPEKPGARLVFAAAVALAATVMIAPQTTEFGAKVGLLAGLAVLSPLRYVVDAAAVRLARRGGLLAWATSGTRRIPVIARGAVVGALAVFVIVGLAAAGAPARQPQSPRPVGDSLAVEVEVDASLLPVVTVAADVAALDAAVADDPQAVAIALARALLVEEQAMLRLEPSLLRSADTGARLVEQEAAIASAVAAGERVVARYRFDTIHLDVAFTDGAQGGASLAVEAQGEVTEVTFDEEGATVETTTTELASTFVMVAGPDGSLLLSATG